MAKKIKDNVIILGFGSVGRSFYKISNYKLDFVLDPKKTYIIDKSDKFLNYFVKNGGLESNYIVKEISKNNFQSIIIKDCLKNDKELQNTIILDFLSTAGTDDIIKWCALNNIKYLNTGDSDWPEDEWRDLISHYNSLQNIKKYISQNKLSIKSPIVLQSGMNPGLVSHFMKKGLEFIVETQFKDNNQYKKLLKDNHYNKLAQNLGVKFVQIVDRDFQKTKLPFKKDVFYNTWNPETFYSEITIESELCYGNNENFRECDEVVDFNQTYHWVKYKTISANTNIKALTPFKFFKGFLVGHEEVFTFSRFLSVEKNKTIVYCPTTMFIYRPCDITKKYLAKREKSNYSMPTKSYVLTKEIYKGSELVGVNIIGDKFKSVFVGNMVTFDKKSELMKDHNSTILQVSSGAMGAFCWILKNKTKGGIYLPEEIDSNYVLNIAKKYMGQIIYHTYDVKKTKKFKRLKDFF